MLGREDVTAWTAVGTSAFAALLVVLAIWLLLRWRRASERRLESVQASASRAEEMLAELGASLERVRAESETARPGASLRATAEESDTAAAPPS